MAVKVEELIRLQTELGWSNKRVAAFAIVSDQSVSNWRCSRQAIPHYVINLLRAAREIIALKKRVAELEQMAAPTIP